MKKIVGMVAALAVATSAFAVDLNSMIQIDGDAMNYSEAGGFKALDVKDYDPQGTSDYVWKMSATTDKAGAEIWYYSTGSGNLAKDSTLQNYSLWFKPIDSLKVTIGSVDYGSALKPQFGWWAYNAELASYGIGVDYTYDALSLSLALAPGAGNYWFDSSAEGYKKIGNFWFDARYQTNYGLAQIYVAKGAAVHPHGFTGWNASDLAVGAAWGNNPYMQNGYFVDVAATFSDGKKIVPADVWAADADTEDGLAFEKVVSQIYGQYFIDSFGVQFINVLKYTPKSVQKGSNTGWAWAECDAEFKYGFELKARYAMEGWTPYIQINGYSIMDKSMEIDLGCDTSVGACSINAYVAIPVAFEDYSFSFSVPVEFTVNL